MGQVVELIGRTDWPPGYQPQLLVQGTFEGGVRQEDITRLSGLSTAVFCRVDDSRMAELREEARADPHTLLLFTAADTLTIVYPYELDTGYEVHLQRQFYQKAFLYGNDYYEQLLGVESVRKGRDAGRRIALVHDGEAYYNPQADPFLAWEVKEGCRRQTSRTKSNEGLRERKPNYREVQMGLDEIEEWLDRHVELRRNVITMRTEYRWKDDGVPRYQDAWGNFDDHAYQGRAPAQDGRLRLRQRLQPLRRLPALAAAVGRRRLYRRAGGERDGSGRAGRVGAFHGVPAQVAGGHGGGLD